MNPVNCLHFTILKMDLSFDGGMIRYPDPIGTQSDF